jgi:maltooligosyltrehalose trehalohydrolase
LGKATAEGRIAEFEKMGWDPDIVPDPQDPASFTRSKLNWEESASGDHARLLGLYQELAVLRRSRPEFTDPHFSHLSATYSDERRWFRLERRGVTTLINFSDNSVTLPIPVESTTLFTTDATVRLVDGEATLPPRSAVIVAHEPELPL